MAPTMALFVEAFPPYPSSLPLLSTSPPLLSTSPPYLSFLPCLPPSLPRVPPQQQLRVRTSDRGVDAVDVFADDEARCDGVPRSGEELGNGLPARVRLQRARVGEGEDNDPRRDARDLLRGVRMRCEAGERRERGRGERA